MHMPMQYQSLAGDMDFALSGGQRLRIPMARANRRFIMEGGTLIEPNGDGISREHASK